MFWFSLKLPEINRNINFHHQNTKNCAQNPNPHGAGSLETFLNKYLFMLGYYITYLLRVS